jgi:hypothetical protein
MEATCTAWDMVRTKNKMILPFMLNLGPTGVGADIGAWWGCYNQKFGRIGISQNDPLMGFSFMFVSGQRYKKARI